MGQVIAHKQTTSKPFLLGIIIVAALMILFGLAEVVTSFTHRFFGLTIAQIDTSTYLGIASVLSYAVGSILIVTRKRWAAIMAIVLLCSDVLGRIAMVIFGLYGLYQSIHFVRRSGSSWVRLLLSSSLFTSV